MKIKRCYRDSDTAWEQQIKSHVILICNCFKSEKFIHEICIIAIAISLSQQMPLWPKHSQYATNAPDCPDDITADIHTTPTYKVAIFPNACVPRYKVPRYNVPGYIVQGATLVLSDSVTTRLDYNIFRTMNRKILIPSYLV